jgi:hypothetical protein
MRMIHDTCMSNAHACLVALFVCCSVCNEPPGGNTHTSQWQVFGERPCKACCVIHQPFALSCRRLYLIGRSRQHTRNGYVEDTSVAWKLQSQHNDGNINFMNELTAQAMVVDCCTAATTRAKQRPDPQFPRFDGNLSHVPSNHLSKTFHLSQLTSTIVPGYCVDLEWFNRAKGPHPSNTSFVTTTILRSCTKVTRPRAEQTDNTNGNTLSTSTYNLSLGQFPVLSLACSHPTNHISTAITHNAYITEPTIPQPNTSSSPPITTSIIKLFTLVK